jgi:protein-S-isoprenylcysteine O-methyltransferase Ste14
MEAQSFKPLCVIRRKNMDEKKTSTEFTPKSKLTKTQAIIVMVVGGLVLLLAIVIPAEIGSTGFTIKVILGLLGFVVACVGSVLRPEKAPENPKE